MEDWNKMSKGKNIERITQIKVMLSCPQTTQNCCGVFNSVIQSVSWSVYGVHLSWLLSDSYSVFLFPALITRNYFSGLQSTGLTNGIRWYKVGEKPRYSFSPLCFYWHLWQPLCCLLYGSWSCGTHLSSWSYWKGPLWSNLTPVTTAPGFGSTTLSLYSSSPSVVAVSLFLPLSGMSRHLLFNSLVLSSLV